MWCAAIPPAPRSWRLQSRQADEAARLCRNGQRLLERASASGGEDATARLKARSETLGLDKVVQVAEQERRRIVVTVDEASWPRRRRLDGCYALRTDLPKTVVGKEIVHDRYKGHSAHIRMDVPQLQIRARSECGQSYLRDEPHARPRPWCVMLAYLLVHALRQRWRDIDLTVQEGLDRLASLCVVEVIIGGRPSYNQCAGRARRRAPDCKPPASPIAAALPLDPGPRSHRRPRHSDEKRNKVNPLSGAR